MDDAGWMSPIYMRLRDAYGKYRDHWDGLPKIEISDGALLRTGDKGERVRMLRRRLGVPEGAIFDKRSEEHTSELQSLMRISYAVFCLKTKINTKHSSPT